MTVSTMSRRDLRDKIALEIFQRYTSIRGFATTEQMRRRAVQAFNSADIWMLVRDSMPPDDAET